MRLAVVIFTLLVVGYGTLFSVQQQQTSQAEPAISPPLPAIVQQATLGFFQELASEMLFVKCAVFIGNNVPSAVMRRNADSLSLNFDVATSLYPQFIDPYYLCQSSLPHLSPEYAAITNNILSRYPGLDGQHAIILPFYRGFNFFYYMDKPQQAAKVFSKLSKKDGAPSWFGHFAGLLSARGGNLRTGLISLQSMLAVETDELMRERYKTDIETFKQAIAVQKDTESYRLEYGSYPAELTDLVPEFLPHIPTFTSFELKWQPPVLKLIRPIRQNK